MRYIVPFLITILISGVYIEYKDQSNFLPDNESEPI